ncbi:MAG: hypothetical protein LW852_06225 [Sediminibacterium sp.]|jgi:hypothetical protein|nr:hypothetical protein [Sediminibacterium sp.]
MGARTRQVGGGSATPVADEFNNFLLGQLRTVGGGGTPMLSPANPQFLQQFDRNNPNTNFENWSRQQQSNANQPAQQSGSAFGNAFNNALTGQVQDNSGAFGQLRNALADPSQFNAPTNFQNPYNSQQFAGANLSQLPTNFGAGMTGRADLSGFGNTATANFNTQQNLGGVNSGFSGTLNDLISRGSNNLNMGGGFSAAGAGPEVNMNQGMDFRQAYDTLGQDPLMERNRMRAVADMRARFGAEGAGGLGTGAQFAESNMNAELAAQDASARRGQAMQLMGQDLADRNAMANVGLQNRGQNVQTSIANMQGGIQGNQNQISALNALTSAAVAGRGQDMSTGLGMRGQNLEQLGLGNQQSMFNAGQTNNVNMNMLGANLQNQQMGNNFGLGAAGLNNNAMQNNNANAMGMAGMQNNFNLANANNMAQFGLGTNQLNSQNMGMNNNMFNSLINSGMNMNALGNSNMMGMLGQLFGGFQQSNALGTPQAQVISQPSPWAQGANMLGQLGSAWLMGGGGNPFGGRGGGGNIPQMPPVNIPTGNMNALGSMAPMAQWRTF